MRNKRARKQLVESIIDFEKLCKKSSFAASSESELALMRAYGAINTTKKDLETAREALISCGNLERFIQQVSELYKLPLDRLPEEYAYYIEELQAKLEHPSMVQRAQKLRQTIPPFAELLETAKMEGC